MSWRVFGGQQHEIYMALLKERCLRDGLGTDERALDEQFRLHLHRGIAYLAGDRRVRDGVGALVGMAAGQARVEIARHRTALVRGSLSRPLRLAIADGLLDAGRSLMDYGCGRGGATSRG